MKTYEATRKIVRQSDSHFTETAIQPQMNGNKFEFEARSYFKYPGKPDEKSDLNILTISNKWGMGIQVELLKVGEKRNTELSMSIGLDQVEILLEYLQSIKSQLNNYNGEVIEKI